MRRQERFFDRLLSQRQLLWMSVPLILYVLLFSYIPIWGWTMAFQNYKPARSFLQQQWAGLHWFRFLFTDAGFLRVLRNTVAMSFINMGLGYVTAIVFALLLNELRKQHFKRVVQTISYLPTFSRGLLLLALWRQCFRWKTAR